jgi:hypothetical protein
MSSYIVMIQRWRVENVCLCVCDYFLNRKLICIRFEFLTGVKVTGVLLQGNSVSIFSPEDGDSMFL